MTGLDRFLYAFHGAATSVWYLVLVAIFVLAYFGSGIYATWSEKRAEKNYRAEYVALRKDLAECKTGHHYGLDAGSVVVQLGNGGEL